MVIRAYRILKVSRTRLLNSYGWPFPLGERHVWSVLNSTVNICIEDAIMFVSMHR